DEITTDAGHLVDYLGTRRRYRAGFSASVERGALTMASTGMSIRVGSVWLPAPRWICPKVTLTERFDDHLAQQHGSVTTTVPGIGRVYQYAGSFDYEVRQDGGSK